jgi:hypothetical protein
VQVVGSAEFLGGGIHVGLWTLSMFTLAS